MVGTLQLSRTLADRQLADAVLEQGIQNALAILLGAEHQGTSESVLQVAPVETARPPPARISQQRQRACRRISTVP
jgi:hypothetical protein